MIKILFICLGNICRSPMAEFVLKDMAARRGLASKFYIASAATSAEEIGNPVHWGTREKLKACGISTAGKYAVQMKRQDYEDYDYLLGMEERNISNCLLYTSYLAFGKDEYSQEDKKNGKQKRSNFKEKRRS